MLSSSWSLVLVVVTLVLAAAIFIMTIGSKGGPQ